MSSTPEARNSGSTTSLMKATMRGSASISSVYGLGVRASWIIMSRTAPASTAPSIIAA